MSTTTAPLTSLFLFLATLTPSLPALALDWPRGEVVIPTQLFKSNSKLDQVVLESNPRLYLPREFDPKADHILVIGMPGWGGRSENFIGCLYNGLTGRELRRRLVLAAIQDPQTRGPRFQGQGEAIHANVWTLDDESIPALRHFVQRLGEEFGHLRVYLLGYSSGSPAAPLAAVRIGQSKVFTVEGAIALGTASPVAAKWLIGAKQRVLFLVAPKMRGKEITARRYDQGKRANAEFAETRLRSNGATVYLRHIESARRHFDWHWGLMSQCRYFRSNRYDDGRGYWPNYWMPNPETFGYVTAFVQGNAPPEELAPPLTQCPHPPNVNNPDDPDAKVRDEKRQTPWAPGTLTPDVKNGAARKNGLAAKKRPR